MDIHGMSHIITAYSFRVFLNIQLEILLQEMPIVKKNGKPGLLSTRKLGTSVDSLSLFDISEENDSRVISALFRDYSFLASAYIFEPCHYSLADKGDYGLARSTLPKNIAIPLVELSKRLKTIPFLSYAYSYALFNWMKKDEEGGAEFANLDMILTFTGHKSEIGFMLVHVTMNQFSGKLVEGAVKFLNGIEWKDPKECELAMECILDTMRHINQEMNTMWTRNNHEDYNHYRTFIFGAKNQPVLPHGLIYEGVDTEPKFYRGESGACDSIIPLMDNILELTLEMPDNELTDILRDFRSCRPESHINFLKWLQDRGTNLKAKDFAVDVNPILFLKLLDQVREFRNRHWNFAKVYIMQHTNYPVATGGSPIIKWLPNQLMVVHKEIQLIVNTLETASLNEKDRKFTTDLLELSENQSASLMEQVKALTTDFTQTQEQISENYSNSNPKSLY